MEEDSSRFISIPVRNSPDYVVIKVNDLPDRVEDLLKVLTAEIAPLDVWLESAVCRYSGYMNCVTYYNAEDCIEKFKSFLCQIYSFHFINN